MLVLTARGNWREKVQGIDGGADSPGERKCAERNAQRRTRVLGEVRFDWFHRLEGSATPEVHSSQAYVAADIAPLAVWMIEDLKILANKRDVPYQSLLKGFLAKRLEQERRRVI